MHSDPTGGLQSSLPFVRANASHLLCLFVNFLGATGVVSFPERIEKKKKKNQGIFIVTATDNNQKTLQDPDQWEKKAPVSFQTWDVC